MPDLLDRLSDKFLVGDGCWPWIASRDQKGYGMFRVGGRKGLAVRAHRVLYELMVEPIPDGLQIDHLCRNPQCVRPDHLEPVTGAENVRRGISAGNRDRSTCKRGHPFDEANTYWHPRGQRCCRACTRERAKRQRRAEGVEWTKDNPHQSMCLVCGTEFEHTSEKAIYCSGNCKAAAYRQRKRGVA